MKSIFDKTVLGSLELKNRLFRSATWEGLADSNGNITEECIEIYEELAKGGVGTIITGMTTVSSYDSEIYGMMRFNNNSFIPAYEELTLRLIAKILL